MRTHGKENEIKKRETQQREKKMTADLNNVIRTTWFYKCQFCKTWFYKRLVWLHQPQNIMQKAHFLEPNQPCSCLVR